MLGYTRDLDRTFRLMDQLRRRMDRMLDDYDPTAENPGLRSFTGSFPRTNLYDTGQALVLEADLPGMAENDVTLNLTNDVLTLSGEHKTEVPDGYGVHRRERLPIKFSRSFALPAKIDPDKTHAVMKDGVLTVTLEKAPELKPRQISVKTS
jgi:HSP20 family protein